MTGLKSPEDEEEKEKAPSKVTFFIDYVLFTIAICDSTIVRELFSYLLSLI